MATKTITDAGSARATYQIERRPADNTCTITIATTDGDSETVSLGQADITATLTAGERSALAATLDKLYAAALTKRGFA